jgi:predicted O-methyltransferase YrrM
MTGRKQQVYLVTGALVAVGGFAGVAALLGNERLALFGLAVLATFVAVVSIATFARVTNSVRLLVKARDNASTLKAGGGIGRDGEREEIAERRIIGLFEAERIRAADRHRETMDAVEALKALTVESGDRSVSAVSEVGQDVLRVRSDGRRARQDESRSVEAMMQLREGTTLRAPMPPSGKWALDARSILELLELVKMRSPETVVELGGGTSTIWLGYALEGTTSKIISVDHDPDYADITRWNVERHGLAGTVEVRVAPLQSWAGPESSAWYAREAFDGIDGIDLLLIDGPPEGTAPEARYPALPALLEKLSPGAIVILDDADRAVEKKTVDRWLEEHPGLSKVRGDYGRMSVLRVAG